MLLIPCVCETEGCHDVLQFRDRILWHLCNGHMVAGFRVSRALALDMVNHIAFVYDLDIVVHEHPEECNGQQCDDE